MGWGPGFEHLVLELKRERFFSCCVEISQTRRNHQSNVRGEWMTRVREEARSLYLAPPAEWNVETADSRGKERKVVVVVS